MSSSLYRLGRAMARAGWKVVAVWAVLLLGLGGLALGLGGSFSTEFEIPGTESQNGLTQLDRRFPEMGGTSGQIVFVAQNGTVDDQSAAVDDVMEQIADVEGVAAAPSPFDDVSPGTRNDDGSAIIAQFQMDGQIGQYPASSVDEIEQITEDSSTDALSVNLGGQVLQSGEIHMGAGEIIGVVVALIVLAIVFRALLPAIIPIVTAVVGVGVSMLGVLALSAGLEIPSVTTALGAMLGLAVGIDYALFILSRHRGQLAEGEDVDESIGSSIATSGSAVIFAGLTVIIALVGLFVTGIPFLTIMGVAAAGTVALAVLVALTLLPALMGMLGERLRPRKVRRLMEAGGGVLPAAADRDAPSRRPFGTGWVRLATRVPALTILIVVLGIGALAIPIKDLELALPDNGTEAPGTPARDTYDLIAEQFGPGYNGPLLVTADIINSEDPLGVVEDLESDVEALPGVREIQIATPNRGADLAVISLVPEGGPTDQSTKDLVEDLRSSAPMWEEELGISDVTVTGATAVGIDITSKLTGALVPFAIFVVGLSLILLTLVFRSLWVPLKASLGYLLSVGAAMGVTAMVFDYGWANEPLFVSVNGPVVAFMPIMVMGVLFGLAMDYEMFLVSRMREEYVHTGDARGSIERGFTGSAPVVIAAALIMTAVFSGFVTSGWFMLQPIAIGLAVGVLVDAFVVRMTLVPAVLALLGDRAWRLPRWLDSVLPKVDVEGEGLVDVLEHRRWTAEHGDAALRLDGVRSPLLDDELAEDDAPRHLGPLTGSVAPGSVLVVRSPDDAARATFLALASGRIAPQQGILAVHDRLAQIELGAVQAQVQRIGAGADLARALRSLRTGRRAPLVVLEQIEDLDRALRAEPALVGELEDLLEQGVSLIVGSSSSAAADIEHELAAALRDPSRLQALAVQPSAGPSPAPTHAAGSPAATHSASEGALA